MRKKEKEEFYDLKEKLRLIKAMVLTEVNPPDIPIQIGSEKWWGWDFNSFRTHDHVWLSWSTPHANGAGIDFPEKGGKALYSSKSRALKACRAEKSIRFAKELAYMDQLIAHAEKEESVRSFT